jgi:hypothetical protein
MPTGLIICSDRSRLMYLLNTFSQIAGQDKSSSNGKNPIVPKLNPIPSNGNNPVMPKLNPIPLPKQTQFSRCSDMPVSPTPAYPVVNGRIASFGFSPAPYPYGVHPQCKILSSLPFSKCARHVGSC